MRKVVRPGTILDYRGRRMDVYCKIEIDNGNLLISGVEGPMRNGDAVGSCGQIKLDADVMEPAPGWTRETIAKFAEVWKRWHLNDMRPGCEHQRAEGWSERPIDPNKPIDTYGVHFEGQRSPSWNMLGWIRPDEHPNGLLGKPCPTCGYRYGTAWLHEALPTDVIAFLEGLPDTDKTPAWV